MSRTFGMTTPSRRSKRLLQNGYYRLPADDVANWLDGPASDEDETTSMDSNLSKLSFGSEQRRVEYKESPTFPFNHRRKRNNSGSPRRNGNVPGTSQQQDNETRIVKARWTSHSRRGRARPKLNSTTSAMNVLGHEGRRAPVFDSVSVPVASHQLRDRTNYPNNNSYQFEGGENHHGNNLGGGEQIMPRQHQPQDNERPGPTDAIGDGVFKMPSPKTHPGLISHRISQTHVVMSSSETRSVSGSYSSEDDNLEEASLREEHERMSSHSPSTRVQENRERPLLFFFRLVHFCASYFATVIWETARALYQNVLRLLVLDTWLLTRRIQVEQPVAPAKMARWKKALLYLTVIIVGCFGLYYCLSIFYKAERSPIFAAPISFSTWFGPTDPPSYTADMRSTESMQRSLQKLELSLREMELRIADRHANVLNRIKLLQTGYEVDLEKLSQSQKNVLSMFEDRMEKHVSLELLKNSEYLQDKLYDVQMELSYLRTNHTNAVQMLRDEIESHVELSKGASQELLDKLTEFEKQLLTFDGRVDILRKDHRAEKVVVMLEEPLICLTMVLSMFEDRMEKHLLNSIENNILDMLQQINVMCCLKEKIVKVEIKSYIFIGTDASRNLFKANMEKHAGNITFLKEISNNQFIENFLFLLQKGTTGAPNAQSHISPENRRYQFLSLVFLEWLGKRGFVQEKDLQKMQEQILKNSSEIEKNFKVELEKSVTVLKKAAKSKENSGISLTTITPQSRSSSSSSKISENLVKAWIQESLDLYSADRIGLPDFALESAGAAIVNTRCSESFLHKTALVSILGFPIYYNINTPRSIIQPGVMPGECWAFKGTQGYVVVSLSSKILPTAFTLDHIPKSLALYNNISSAPKDFSVYGLKQANDKNGLLLGTFRYEESGSPIQHFPIDDSYKVEDAFTCIELRIASNWGHPDFTCIYRFRVHGQKTD